MFGVLNPDARREQKVTFLFSSRRRLPAASLTDRDAHPTTFAHSAPTAAIRLRTTQFVTDH